MTALAGTEPEEGLVAHFKLLSLTTKVVWPNAAPYSPVLGTAYYRVAFLAVPSERLTMGKADRHAGILQIDCVSPSKQGLFPALAMARAVALHFDRQRLVQAGVAIHIIKAPSVGAHGQDPDWYTIPVSITYEIIN